jgi:hypothetical protein
MRAPWALRAALRAAWLVFVSGALSTAGCSNILGLREALDDGDCVLNSDCAPDKACIFRVCSPQCQADKDCPTAQRCLRTDNGAACINSSSAGCDRACPEGTICDPAQRVCRNGCSGNTDCLGGQVCTDGVCRGSDTGHDPVVSDAGGRDSSIDGTAGSGGTAGRGGSNGSGGASASGGTAGTSGSGGTGGSAGSGGRGGSGGGSAGSGGTAGGTAGSAGTGGTGTGGNGGANDGSTGDTVNPPTDSAIDAPTGICTLGTRRCNSKTPQRCDAPGVWVDDGSPCAFICQDGVCSGVCAPRSTRCSNGAQQT